ncbi:MAG TPA: ribbon-helix-helix protein, CopG family [Terracidiphilus sp.]|jgi:antitoxin ParD1/3/4
MAAIERLTITLPAEMAGLVKRAVDEGNYASTSEVIREALRDWKVKRELQLGQLAELKADIDRGLADVAEGRVATFDAKRIIARGRKLLEDRSNSASPRQQS